MTKKSYLKKIKKNFVNDPQNQNEQQQARAYDKQKKIFKEPKIKDTVLSDIELQIVDMFSRSFSNGQIGVKFPQQKKKGMMRLMNFCFRTILEEVELHINNYLKKESLTKKCLDRKEKTIYHLSSNYRYKHIEKNLLEDFKLLCRTYVKYRSFEHMDKQFLQGFFDRVIHNQFTINSILSTKEGYKPLIKKIDHKKFENQSPIEQEEPQLEAEYLPENFKQIQKVVQVADEPKVALRRRGRKKGYKKQIKNNIKKEKKKKQIQNTALKKSQEFQLQDQQNQKQNIHQNQKIDECRVALQIDDDQADINNMNKSNKICIQKINIYFGYDKQRIKSETPDDIKKRIEAHPFARIQVTQDQKIVRQWTLDMEAELIDQFMSINAGSLNIVIRNLMKKFGRNKLFVEAQILEKKKKMFKVCISKYVDAFDGKMLCSRELVREMQKLLKNMSLSPKNFFVARFLHDFYFKQVEAISVTLLSEYIHKLCKQSNCSNKNYIQVDNCYLQNDIIEKKRLLDRQDLKYALDTMSKLVSNYTYQLSTR